MYCANGAAFNLKADLFQGSSFVGLHYIDARNVHDMTLLASVKLLHLRYSYIFKCDQRMHLINTI